MIKAVIFDVDGVLIDNTEIIIRIFQETARKCGLRIPDERTVKNYFGRTRVEMVQNILGKDERILKTYDETWMEHENEMKLMPGIDKILDEIKLPKAVMTSKSLPSAERSLKGLLHHFRATVTMEETKKHKPDPEPLLLACKKLNLKPNECVYVGDHINDFKTAKSAGTDFIGILSGGTTEEEFKKAGANKLINSLSELPEILKSI